MTAGRLILSEAAVECGNAGKVEFFLMADTKVVPKLGIVSWRREGLGKHESLQTLKNWLYQ